MRPRLLRRLAHDRRLFALQLHAAHSRLVHPLCRQSTNSHVGPTPSRSTASAVEMYEQTMTLSPNLRGSLRMYTRSNRDHSAIHQLLLTKSVCWQMTFRHLHVCICHGGWTFQQEFCQNFQSRKQQDFWSFTGGRCCSSATWVRPWRFVASPSHKYLSRNASHNDQLTNTASSQQIHGIFCALACPKQHHRQVSVWRIHFFTPEINCHCEKREKSSSSIYNEAQIHRHWRFNHQFPSRLDEETTRKKERRLWTTDARAQSESASHVLLAHFDHQKNVRTKWSRARFTLFSKKCPVDTYPPTLPPWRERVREMRECSRNRLRTFLLHTSITKKCPYKMIANVLLSSEKNARSINNLPLFLLDVNVYVLQMPEASF